MKEFEKWLKEKYPQYKEGSWGREFGIGVWKAALEMVMDIYECTGDPTDRFSYGCETKREIEKELGDA